jgi:uncharacterized damage-inducible protein DinB
LTEDRESLLASYRTARADLLAAIEGIPDELMVERSLDGWSVKDHLLHLALWDELRSAEVQRISAGFESAWRMSDEQDDAYNTIGHDLRQNLSIEQARWELATSHQRLVDAIAAAGARGLNASLYGEAGLVRSGHDVEHAGWIRQWRASKRI